MRPTVYVETSVIGYLAIEGVCRQFGYDPPVICTPQELLEIDDVL
jgi:hypothetical protein